MSIEISESAPAATKGRVVSTYTFKKPQEDKLGETQGNVVTKERVERKLQQLEQITSPHEAQAQVAVLPLVAVHEARYAVQQFKDQYGVDANSLEILEPIIRNI